MNTIKHNAISVDISETASFMINELLLFKSVMEISLEDNCYVDWILVEFNIYKISWNLIYCVFV